MPIVGTMAVVGNHFNDATLANLAMPALSSRRRQSHRLGPWEAPNDMAILNEARWEISRSVAWGLAEEPALVTFIRIRLR